jgi:alkaline phosphatase D
VAVRNASAAAAPQFAHGVASGDPLPDGILLWTRVTPTPDALPGSGAGPRVEVRWEVASDAAFTSVVHSGTVGAGPDTDHTVKVDVSGLAPATTYWYRFSLDGAYSGVGRTRTAPAADAAVAGVRFGVVSCSNWQGGYFAAYRHLAARDDLDAILHLGDYLYEYQVGGFGARGVTIRPHQPATEMISLADYRRRHAQYKTDADLQALHARYPWIITWDDHETANDAWSGGAENHQPATEGDYAIRSAAARRAYLEWMPIRSVADRIYRRLRFGRLAELSMLDLRSYRSKQVAPTDGSGVEDPNRTITGDAQLGWLRDGLSGTAAQWKLVGNPVMIAPVSLDLVPNNLLGPIAKLLGLSQDGIALNADQWDGYAVDRRELLQHLVDRRVTDTVFLTGDIHSSWANEVPLDAATYPGHSPSVATEFVTTSVTSDNVDDFLKVAPRTLSLLAEGGIRALNRHVRAVEVDSHGFSVVDVRPDRLQTDWWYLADRTSAASTARHAASFTVASRSQRVVRSSTPLGPRAL